MSNTIEHVLGTTHVAAAVAALGDELWTTLSDLVRFASVNPNGNQQNKAVADCRADIVKRFRAAGVPARELVITYNGRSATPLVYADYKCSNPNAPTVLIYSHYDVQPAKKEDGWQTDPFVPVDKPDGADVRKYGRGAADDKSGIVMHLGVAKAFGSKGLPVNLRLVFEGEEEQPCETLESFLADEKEDHSAFKADLVVVADCGNVVLGKPTITTTLRGYAVFDVTVRTLQSTVHSGMYGGPAPDAFMTLVRMLAALHDDHGDVAVPGLVRDDAYPFAKVDEPQFRAAAGVVDGIPLIGTGILAQRLGGRPSVNVIGLDGPPPTESAPNVLRPYAKARISVRLAPTQDPQVASKIIADYLKNLKPWGIHAVEVKPLGAGAGYTAKTTGPRFKAAAAALSQAYGGQATVYAGQGGSIPLVNALQKANPDAEVVLWGCEEPRCRIHSTDESVSKAELLAMTTAEALLLQQLR